MTTEQKAKAYDKALLEWMRKVYLTLTGADKEDTEHYFPELKESEDERMIEQIKFAVMQMPSDREDTKKECLAWLEKQKQVEVKDPSKEELKAHNKILCDFKCFATKQAREHHIFFTHDFEWDNFCEEILSYFNQYKVILKEKDAWCCSAAWACVRDSEEYTGTEKVCIRQFLDRCNPVSQPHWKPSEEQMKIFQEAVVYFGTSWISRKQKILESLYEDLKRL